jgi:glycerate dehydrogenase
MKIVILDAATLGNDLSFDRLRELGDLTVYQTTAQEDVAKRIQDCDAVILNKLKLTLDILSSAKNLKLICETATGYDNIDLEAARKLGIAVCNVPGYSTPSVVQVTLAMALSLATNLPEFSENVSSGKYSKGNCANTLTPVFHELSGKTWGIVGYGNIGKGVADVARALGCKILVCRNHPDGSDECVDIDTLCKNSDIISIHTPLSDSTRGLINEDRIATMKRDTIIINVARGAVTDEKAIAAAILEGRLGGFGCDVYSVEPFRADHPFYSLLGHPRVCLTPHMAWGSYESRVRCLDTVTDNIRAFYAGEKQNRVDHDATGQNLHI